MKALNIALIGLMVSVEALAHTLGVSYGLSRIGSDSISSGSASYQYTAFRIFDEKLELRTGIRGSLYRKISELGVGSSSTFKASSVNIRSLNILVGAEYQISPLFSGGMNIDIIGFSVGEEVDLYANGAGAGRARPVSGNFLLGGTNDKGSLNSEFFVGIKANDTLKVRSGFSHQVLEFEGPGATEKLQKFSDLFFIGIDWTP